MRTMPDLKRLAWKKGKNQGKSNTFVSLYRDDRRNNTADLNNLLFNLGSRNPVS